MDPLPPLLLYGTCTLDRVQPWGAPDFAGPGRAGAVAAALTSLGLDCALAATLGEDAEGRLLLDFLVEEGVDARLIRIDPSRRTPVRRILLPQPGQPAAAVCDVPAGAEAADPKLGAAAAGRIAVQSPRIFWHDAADALPLARLARSRGALVIYEPHDEDGFLESARHAHIVKHAETRLSPPETDAPLRIAEGDGGVHYSLAGGPWRRAATAPPLVAAGAFLTAGAIAELLHLAAAEETLATAILRDEGAVRSALNLGVDLAIADAAHAQT